MPFHPWRLFRERPQLELMQRTLPGDLRGTLLGNVVTLDSRLLQAERRCAILHELRHHDLGHEGCQPPAVEREVHAWVARMLIPMDLLLDKLAWTESLEELAEECWVDPPTLMARLDGLSVVEREMIRVLGERTERGA